MSPTANVHIFGIRHHGPGSARSLLRALHTLQPDVILVEGPPDADEVLPLLAQADMKPPVALLIYAPDQPQQAVYLPIRRFFSRMASSALWPDAPHSCPLHGLTANASVRGKSA